VRIWIAATNVEEWQSIAEAAGEVGHTIVTGVVDAQQIWVASTWRDDAAFAADVQMGIALGMPVLDLDRAAWIDQGW
jgi:hypothetical protein